MPLTGKSEIRISTFETKAKQQAASSKQQAGSRKKEEGSREEALSSSRFDHDLT
jgi:hypothetical protein